MLQFEFEPSDIVPQNGTILYRDFENLLVINQEDIHDTFGCVDQSKVIELAISKYNCLPYKLDGVGRHNHDLIFIKE